MLHISCKSADISIIWCVVEFAEVFEKHMHRSVTEYGIHCCNITVSSFVDSRCDWQALGCKPLRAPSLRECCLQHAISAQPIIFDSVLSTSSWLTKPLEVTVQPVLCHAIGWFKAYNAMLATW